jgi:hypothetical protein
MFIMTFNQHQQLFNVCVCAGTQSAHAPTLKKLLVLAEGHKWICSGIPFL